MKQGLRELKPVGRVMVGLVILVCLALLALPALLLLRINSASNKLDVINRRNDQGRAAVCQQTLELGLTPAPICKDRKVRTFYNVNAQPQVAGSQQLADVAARNRAPTCLVARWLVGDELEKLEAAQGQTCEGDPLPPPTTTP